jgi:hypothetical protein
MHPRRINNPLLAFASGLVALSTVAACSSQSRDYTDDDRFAAYMANIDSFAMIEIGIDRLINFCLSDLGLEDRYAPKVHTFVESDDPNDYLMALGDRVSLEEAERVGYGDKIPNLFFFDEGFDFDQFHSYQNN